MDYEKNNYELDLMHIAEIILSRWFIISIAAVIFGTLAFIYSTCFVTAQYTSEASVYVNSLKSFDLNNDSVSSTTLNATKQLVPTYMEISKSKRVISKAVTNSKLDYSVSDVTGMIKTRSIEETGIFHITVSCSNPRHAAVLANTVAEVAIDEIENYIEGTSAKIIDYAEVSSAPTSPNIKNTTLLGFLLGIILSIAVLILLDLLDVHIKSEDDLSKISDYPLLGTIPRLGTAEGRYGYSYSKYDRYGPAVHNQIRKERME